MRTAIVAVVGALAIGQIVKYADTWQNLANRLKVVSDTTIEAVEAQRKIFNVAQETRQGIEATTVLYTRLSLAAEQMGASQDETLLVTRALNQAVALGGSTAEEASAGLIQFSQGIASNRLQGDELRSVLETLPGVQKLLIAGLQKTGFAAVKSSGDLRDMAAAGELTRDVLFAAIAAEAPQVAKEFDNLSVTIGQAITQMNNNFIRAIGSFGEMTGASEFLSDSFIFLGENIDLIAAAIGTFAVAVGTSAVAAILAKNAATKAQTVAELRSLKIAEQLIKAEVLAARTAKVKAVALAQQTGATNALTAATARLAAAEKAAVVNTLALGRATTTASIGTRALTSALGFFGGPIGFAITAVAGAIFFLSTRTTEAEEAAGMFASQVSKLKAEFSKVAEEGDKVAKSFVEVRKIRLEETIEEQSKALAVLKESLIDTAEGLNSVYEGYDGKSAKVIPEELIAQLKDGTISATEFRLELNKLAGGFDTSNPRAKSLATVFEGIATDAAAGELAIKETTEAIGSLGEASEAAAEKVVELSDAQRDSFQDTKDDIAFLLQKIPLIQQNTEASKQQIKALEAERDAREEGLVPLSDAFDHYVAIRIQLSNLNDEEKRAEKIIKDKASAEESAKKKRESALLSIKKHTDGLKAQNAAEQKILALRREGLDLSDPVIAAMRIEVALREKFSTATEKQIQAMLKEELIKQRLVDINAALNEDEEQRKERIAELVDEIDALATNEERLADALERINEAQRSGDLGKAADESGISEEEAKKRLVTEANEKYNDSLIRAKQFNEDLAGAAGTALKSIFDGSASAKDAMETLIDSVADLIFQLVIVEPILKGIKDAFDDVGDSGGGLGGFLQGLGGSGSSDGGIGGIFSGLFSNAGGLGDIFGGFFAEGGRPALNKVSVVGENGPELFVPDTAGTVMNAPQVASAMGGGVTVVQNISIDARGADAGAEQRIKAQMEINRINTVNDAVNAVQAKANKGGQFSKDMGRR